jgi:large subunit ribosomal protein L19
MANLLEQFENEQLAKLSQKKVDDFAPGDTVEVGVKILEGTTERVQKFLGLCIAKKNRGINSSFIVRKISHGEGVERIFPLYSPLIESVTLVRRGTVRRAKLYYMRDLRGRAARIREKLDLTGQQDGGAESAAEQE